MGFRPQLNHVLFNCQSVGVKRMSNLRSKLSFFFYPHQDHLPLRRREQATLFILLLYTTPTRLCLQGCPHHTSQLTSAHLNWSEMDSSTQKRRKHDVVQKPKVLNVSQGRRRRTEPRPQTTCIKNLVKFGRVVFRFMRADRHRDEQTPADIETKLFKLRCPKSVRWNFFSLWVIDEWYKLPQEVVEASSNNAFLFKNRHWKDMGTFS